MRLTDNLSQRYVIGFGASSTVYKCILKSGKPLAVKKLYHNYQQSTREFEAELDTVGRIKHRNLVSLQGYSLSPHGNLLFYEFMENGSLNEHLQGKNIMMLLSKIGGRKRERESALEREGEKKTEKERRPNVGAPRVDDAVPRWR